jgi:shikimate kinase
VPLSSLNSLLLDRLNGITIYLTGMMGVGKSTIGHLLAARLNYCFLDTDQVIEQLTGQSVSAIFDTQGEATFRQLETQVLREMSAYAQKHLLVATGGGIVLQRENWSYLRHGLVIWLNAPISVLCERLGQDTTRPLLQTEDLPTKLQTLLNERQKLYAQADLQIDIQSTDQPQMVVDRILERIPSVLKQHPTPRSSPDHSAFPLS